jgi:ribosomal protein L29
MVIEIDENKIKELKNFEKKELKELIEELLKEYFEETYALSNISAQSIKEWEDEDDIWK